MSEEYDVAEGVLQARKTIAEPKTTPHRALSFDHGPGGVVCTTDLDALQSQRTSGDTATSAGSLPFTRQDTNTMYTWQRYKARDKRRRQGYRPGIHSQLSQISELLVNNNKWQAAFQGLKRRGALQVRRLMKQQLIAQSPVGLVGGRITPDSIVISQEDGYVLQFTRNGELRRRILLKCEGRQIQVATWTADGSLVACGMSDKTLQIFSADGESKGITNLHCRSRSIAWSDTWEQIAVGCDDNKARVVMDLKKTEMTIGGQASFSDHVVAIRFSSDGTLVAAGSKDKSVKVFNAMTSQVIFHRQYDRVYALCWHPISNYLLIGSDDNVIRFIDPVRESVMFKVDAHTGYVRAVAFTPGGSAFVSAGRDGCIRIFDVESNEQVFHIANNSNKIFPSGIEVGPDVPKQQFMVFEGPKSGNATSVAVYNFWHAHATAPVRQVIRYRESSEENVLCLAVSPGGTMFASGHKDRHVQILNTRTTFPHVYCPRVHMDAVTAVCFSLDSKVLLSGSKDTTVRAYFTDEVKEPTLAANFSSPITCMARSPSDGRIAVGLEEGRVHLLDPVNFFDLMSLHYHNDSINCVHFSPDGGTIATGSSDKKIILFDLEQEKTRHVIKSHSKEVFSICFSPDGKQLLSGGRDKLVKIHDVDTGQERHSLTHHTEHVTAVAFGPNGAVATAGMDHTLHVFDNRIGFSTKNFGARLHAFHSPLMCMAFLPIGSQHEGLLIVGAGDGNLHLVDMSMFDQQPVFDEAQQVIERDLMSNSSYATTKEMLQRFPFTVHSPRNMDGATLMHFAIQREMSPLLEVLLQAPIPRFWLPVDKVGQDPLRVAIELNNRGCIQLLLNTIVSRKHSKLLGCLPISDDRFLKNLLMLTPRHHDLVAEFLRGFGLDEAPDVVRMDTQELVIQCDEAGIVTGTQHRAPRHLWRRWADRHLAEKGIMGDVRACLGLDSTMPATHVVTQYTSIPKMAGTVCWNRKPGEEEHVSIKHSLLHVFVAAGNAQLFGNPLMKQVLQFKWQAYARRLFLKELFLFLLLLVLFVVFSVLVARLPRTNTLKDILQDDDRAIIATVLAAIIPILSLRTLLREAQQLKDTPGTLFRRVITHLGDGWSILQILSALLAIVSCLSFLLRADNARAVVAVAALSLWLQTLYFLRAFAFSGALVRMIFKVLWMSLPYIVVLTIVLLAATNCYFVLFADLKDQGEDWTSFTPQDELYDTLFAVYHTLLLTELETFLGQLEDTRDVVLVKILFVLFTVLVSIFMLNLMINLMQDFMDRINLAEGDAFPFEKARIIVELELSMPNSSFRDKRLFPTWLHVIQPKNSRWDDQTDWRRPPQQGDALANERLQERVDTVGQSLQRLSETVEQHREEQNKYIVEASQARDEMSKALRQELRDMKQLLVQLAAGEKLTPLVDDSHRSTPTPVTRASVVHFEPQPSSLSRVFTASASADQSAVTDADDSLWGQRAGSEADLDFEDDDDDVAPAEDGTAAADAEDGQRFHPITLASWQSEV